MKSTQQQLTSTRCSYFARLACIALYLCISGTYFIYSSTQILTYISIINTNKSLMQNYLL